MRFCLCSAFALLFWAYSIIPGVRWRTGVEKIPMGFALSNIWSVSGDSYVHRLYKEYSQSERVLY